ncbi:hypothetical protein Dimus_039661 [Dionaea muscipula]
MTDLGKMCYYPGIKVEQNSDGIFISQQSYIKKVLDQFGMWNCHPVATPLSPGVKLCKAGNGVPVDPSLYRSLVGSLRYISYTRPDILFAVGLVCRAPMEDHFNVCKRILRYLKGTLSYGLWYSFFSSSEFTLTGFSDSDWGGDFDSRKSTTSFLFCLGETSFTWVSKFQPIVPVSSSEAEYVAITSCVSHGLRLR